MELIALLQSQAWVFYSLVIFIGLAFGSFLNVVIYRLPIMLEKEWRSQCSEFLELENTTPSAQLTLALPASACPKCGHKIRFWENIPVISYLLLRDDAPTARTAYLTNTH